jgi:hypothetical protein
MWFLHRMCLSAFENSRYLFVHLCIGNAVHCVYCSLVVVVAGGRYFRHLTLVRLFFVIWHLEEKLYICEYGREYK